MRIGIDTRFLHLGLTHSKDVNLLGGIAGYLYYLVTHLLQMDTQNTYVLFADRSRPIAPFQAFIAHYSQAELLPLRQPFHMPLVDSSVGASIRAVQTHFKKSEICRANLDLIHCQDDPLGVAALGIREVVSIHAFLARRKPTGWLANYHWAQHVHHLKQVDRLIAISNGVKQDLIDCLELPDERVTTVYHGYEQELFTPSDGANEFSILEKYNLTPGYFLFVGGLTPVKNVQNLLYALSFAKAHYGVDKPLLICGAVFRFFKREFLKMQTLIKKLGIGDQVQIVSYVPHDELPAIFHGACAVVSPSYSEGFGLVPLEAMACGTPVIVSDRPALPEIVGDAGRYVDPENTQDIAQALYDVSHNEDLTKDMRRKGIARAIDFSWEKTARETLAVYKQVLTQ